MFKLISFTQEQILGLIPAQALVDYEQAEKTLNAVAQAQLVSCEKEFAEQVEAIKREAELAGIKKVKDILVENRESATIAKNLHMREKPKDRQGEIVWNARLKTLQELIDIIVKEWERDS